MTVTQNKITNGTQVSDTSVAALDSAWLKQLCLEAGADDVGFVEIDRAEISDQLDDILTAMPSTKTLISFVKKINREAIRTPFRSISNTEFHYIDHEIADIGHKIVSKLEAMKIAALNPAMGFPMEMDRFPGKIWVVSHKPVAVAAGLGKMGIHRNVIHPKFGNFILLGTVLIAEEVKSHSKPIDYNPCLECKLCVAACPTGAIGSDGYFDFSACYTHNYREFMGGFTDWVENIADSKNAIDYRSKVNSPETVSMWQSLSYGANYKAAYCMAVCPAGEDVISLYEENKKQFLENYVDPLRNKKETVYVVPNSDAERYVAKRFKNKKIKQVGNGLQPQSIRGFLDGLPLVFQREIAAGLDAIYFFTFHGVENVLATVKIKEKTVEVLDGHQGKADFKLTADSQTWLKFLSKETNIVWSILRGKIKVKGRLKLLLEFAKCFPV